MRNLKFTLKAWPVIALATIGLCYLTQAVSSLLNIPLKEQQNVEGMRLLGAYTWNLLTTQGIVAALKDVNACKFLLSIPLVIVVMPILEELFFRGVFFKLPTRPWDKLTLETRKGAVLFFAGLSSVLFSAAHYLEQPWPDNAFLALALFGLAQCWLYWKTNAIWCAMLNHGLFNLTNLVLMFAVPTP